MICTSSNSFFFIQWILIFLFILWGKYQNIYFFLVTGVYVRQIFVDELGASPDNNVRRVVPLDNFGEIHPDPNLTYAKDLVDIVRSNQEYDFGSALDGDGVCKTSLLETFLYQKNNLLSFVIFLGS